MGTRERKVYDAGQEITGGGSSGSPARAEVDGLRSRVQKLTATAGDKVDSTLSLDPEKTLEERVQGPGQ